MRGNGVPLSCYWACPVVLTPWSLVTTKRPVVILPLRTYLMLALTNSSKENIRMEKPPALDPLRTTSGTNEMQ
jgi:hypothetical protein